MNIVVLAGGLSPERDVSLSSGALIASALSRRGHAVKIIDVYEGICDLPDDITALAVPLWAHRVIVDPDAAFSGATAEGVIQRALTSVPAPAVGA